jgi:hypothetical protein
MKSFKYIVLLFTVVLFYSCSETAITPIYPGPGASEKVLVEMFTNYRCPYCPPGNAYLDSIYTSSGKTISDTNVIIIRYHTTLYANDPFYDYNAGDNNARQTYYTAHNANPRGFLMGSAMGVFGSESWTAQINNKLSFTPGFQITPSNSYDTSSRSGNISLTLNHVSGSAAADLRLHAALTESGIMYAAPNGETVFNNTMRDLITPPSGDAVTITQGGTLTVSYPYTIANDIAHRNCEIVVFLQSESTKEIFSADKIKLF